LEDSQYVAATCGVSRHMRTATAALALLFAAASAVANSELTLHVTETHPEARSSQEVMKADPNPKMTTTEKNVRVLFGGDYLQIDDGDKQVIRDFAKRRRYDVDAAKKTVYESALLAELLGRSIELDNRIYLNDAMIKAGAKLPFSLAASESELSMRDSKSRTKIDRREEKGVIRFTASRERLAEVSSEVVAADEATRKQFIRLLRYGAGIHPLILDALQNMTGIPRTVDFVHAATDEHIRWAVTELKNVPDAPYVVAAAKREITDDDRAGAAATRALATTPQAFDSAMRKLIDDGVALADRGETFDAFLTFQEVLLAAGQGVPKELADRNEQFKANPNVSALTSALHSQSEQETRDAAATLQKLATASKSKGYVVQIFLGNKQWSLDDSEPAVRNLLAVINEQPLLAGVWHDLGDMAMRGFDTTKAFDCWEIARHLAPNHFLLKNVTELEEELVKSHPEYF